jgi:hypothetical protein
MILDLADLRQRDDWGCGRVAAAVVHAYLGSKGRHPHATPIDGTDPASMEASLWRSGVAVQAGAMDVDDLRYHTRRGRPVIALVTEASGEGHWIVVAGIERGRVWFQCPVQGPMVEPVASFEARWIDETGRRGVTWSRWGIACW